MAGASLFALLDDIASVLDDVALMTKVAATKTAGVLGDDLALNAHQVAGVRAERELPVVWAVALGSMRNKLILVPAALLLSAFTPSWTVTTLLMFGGAFLCYEGVEKLAHRWLHAPTEGEADHDATLAALDNPTVDIVDFEQGKIQGAIRTDFVLSAEIIVIALGTVQTAPLLSRTLVLSGIALLMTVGVYGFVAVIVKMDDAGLHLLGRPGALSRAVGGALLAAAPRLLAFLSVAGTVAVFLVGGGIIAHGIPAVAALVHDAHGPLGVALKLLLDVAVGFVTGIAALALVTGLGKLRR